jgi:7-cyano-7-deazaguanine synthase
VIVLLFSGGLDSTTLLYHLRVGGEEVVPLFVDYGQRHMHREGAAAHALAGKGGLHIASVSAPGIWAKNALTGGVALPAAGIGPESTVVPGRNLILLSLANALAESIGAEALAIGCNADDREIYADCRPEFLRMAELAMGRAVQAPLLFKSKAEIARMAVELGVPIEATWSCYAGGPAQCGRCDACVRRANALEATDRHPFESRMG